MAVARNGDSIGFVNYARQPAKPLRPSAPHKRLQAMVKTSTIPPPLQAEIVRLRLQEDMGPTAIVEYAKRMGWRNLKNKPIKKCHVDTILYRRASRADSSKDGAKTAWTAPPGPGMPPPAPMSHHAAETGEESREHVEVAPASMELLAVEERRALPGLTDEEGRPIRPQGARLELYKAARVVYKLALGDYQKARARGFDRCGHCGMTEEKLTKRIAQGIGMADGILVNAEGSEERAARVQIVQLNFNQAGHGEGPTDPEAPEASSEPVLNTDLVQLLGAYLHQHGLEIEGFFAYVQEERTRA